MGTPGIPASAGDYNSGEPAARDSAGVGGAGWEAYAPESRYCMVLVVRAWLEVCGHFEHKPKVSERHPIDNSCVFLI